MTNFRRNRVPGGTYFFTVNLADRKSDLLVREIETLRDVVRAVREKKPFHIDAWVVLPEHMHCVWTLPPGNSDYVSRWKDIKIAFSKRIPATENLTEVQKQLRERGIWQRRYWEHTIRDERDFAAHVDYCHINPFKHGLVEAVRDWPFSSFHKYVRDGVCAADWAGSVEDIAAGEPS
jgi:putative transposase